MYPYEKKIKKQIKRTRNQARWILRPHTRDSNGWLFYRFVLENSVHKTHFMLVRTAYITAGCLAVVKVAIFRREYSVVGPSMKPSGSYVMPKDDRQYVSNTAVSDFSQYRRKTDSGLIKKFKKSTDIFK